MDRAEIPAYRAFISRELLRECESQLVPVAGVSDLCQIGASGGLETKESLQFLCELYDAVKAELCAVLDQRGRDRAFIDERTAACFALNRSLRINFADPHYRTVIGQEDGDGRIVVGPRSPSYARANGGRTVAPIPAFLAGSHVTLFGPPTDPKLSINAMNAFHRTLAGEPPIVSELLQSFTGSAKWGADDEDSKTPMRSDLIAAGENLTACMQGTITHTDAHTGKKYELAPSHRALAIKRIPGIALPCPFLLLRGNPLPLHLYDFALHLVANWNNPEALVFYLPKLETEEEAAYIRIMIERAEQMIVAIHPQYRLGTIRLMVVLENPRALFRVHEIMDALHPYFAGASLGWHDFLASTARLMKNDGSYRIPVKADPDIVINHIKASHDLLADVVGSRGGIKVGGMYGVLPADGDIHCASFQVAIKGFIKDVIAQMKRNLDGFWVAHPDFVRLGIALVQAWGRHKCGDRAPLDALVCALLHPESHDEVLAFIHGKDVQGLDRDHPSYARSLLVANHGAPGRIAANDPEEIRYNCFQSLQYLADWLAGNGCVALPAIIDGVAVRIMDDLATAERSRWEVWHELHHGRFAYEEFVRIVHQEMHFIRSDLSDGQKVVAVKWNDRTRAWYPVAVNLLLQLMASEKPVEFATELLLPFTLEVIRCADDPWAAARAIDGKKYELPERVARLHAFFSACGCGRFAATMARASVTDLAAAERILRSLTRDEVTEAAHFHGDIGEAAGTLDARAAGEQARVIQDASRATGTIEELRTRGRAYAEKFGFKFLIAAKGRSAQDLLSALQARIDHAPEDELENARDALWQIAKGRLQSSPIDSVQGDICGALARYGVAGASVCVITRGDELQTLEFGTRDGLSPVTSQTRFEIASLSKCIGACFAIEHFRKCGIALTTSVNELFAKTSSTFRVRAQDGQHAAWGDQVTIAHLLSHTALNNHYVNGVPENESLPPIRELLEGSARYGYEPVAVINEPGTKFQYSGGGFMVLQHLIESLARAPIHSLMSGFLTELEMPDTSFEHAGRAQPERARGVLDSGEPIPGERKVFPELAAGAISTASDVGRFLRTLEQAHRRLEGCGPISHDTAVRMVHGCDRGALAFMGCKMGLGIFVAEAGPNRFMIHQGANDGFRALFVHCHQGPDAGQGFVVLCSGEENGVRFIAAVANILLRHLEVRGVDFDRLNASAEPSFLGASQEQRVNAGFRELIFSAFEEDLPEAIVERGAVDALASFNRAVGARVESVSNQGFARAENLLSPNRPTFDPALFGRHGKVMDSWETVRHNAELCDWMIFEMIRESAIDSIALSTQFHLGNHAESVAIEGWSSREAAWVTLLPQTKLTGHALHRWTCASRAMRFRRIRVRMFPDGGITRLALYESDLPARERARVLSQPICPWPPFDPQTRKPLAPKYTPSRGESEANVARASDLEIDLASAALGGHIISASNEHYSPASQVISPYPPLNMADGLESARSRVAGHSEEVVIALASPACIARIELDFTHFVNNNPREVAISGLIRGKWVELVARTEVKPFAGNAISFAIPFLQPCEQVRVTLFPDGGVNRVRVFAAS